MAFLKNVSDRWHIDINEPVGDVEPISARGKRYKIFTHNEPVQVPDELLLSDFVKHQIAKGNLIHVTDILTVEDTVVKHTPKTPFEDTIIAKLPTPDLLAKMTTSLLLEKKVGDDEQMDYACATVSTYVDINGVLQTAAINEPRYEAAGLLIEGKSTNYFENSSRSFSSVGTSTSVISDVFLPDGKTPSYFKTNLLDTKGERGSVGKLINVEAGDYLTASVWVLLEKDAVITFSIARTGVGEYDGKLLQITGTGKWDRVTISHKFKAAYTGIKLTVANQSSSTADSMHYGFFQLERLPIATSFMHTNGTPVTRAESIPSIKCKDNIDNGSKTIVFETSRTLHHEISKDSIRHFAVNDTIGYLSTYLTFDGSKVGGIFRGSSTKVLHKGKELVIYVMDDDRKTGYVLSDGKKTSSEVGDVHRDLTTRSLLLGGFKGETGRYIFGHIKNLRVWNFAVSDKQSELIGKL